MRTIATLLLLATLSHAGTILKKVKYKDGDTILEGIAAYDPDTDAKRPGILVVHQWMGISEHETETATRLVELGYFVLVADIYGKGVRPTTFEAASAESGKYYGPGSALYRRRLQVNLNALQGFKQVDPTRMAAIGFCFGGTGVLELARSGAAVKGVVSFHGGLKTPAPAKKGEVKAKILVCHGANDPFVPDADVTAFKNEMRTAKTDWQLNTYGGAVHSFTQPKANLKGKAEYHEKAAKRSWAAMKAFLKECFG